MAEGDRTQKRFREKLVGLLERYTIHFYVLTTVLYFCMIPASIWVFPSTTLMLTILVLVSGFISSVGALASVLVDLHQNDEIDAAQDDIKDLQDTP
jgi:hypothetical protein